MGDIVQFPNPQEEAEGLVWMRDDRMPFSYTELLATRYWFSEDGLIIATEELKP